MPSLPRDWNAFDTRLKTWVPPQGPFEPSAAWTLRYARHGLVPQPGGKPGGTGVGSLTLTHTPAEGARRLRAVETVAAGFSSPTYTADLACADNALLTPQRWTFEVRWQAGQTARLRPGEIDQALSGQADGSELVFKGLRERRLPAPAHWTAFWNLFAAVPRLPFDGASVLTFDLFEELDLHKPGQRLAYIGPQAFELNGSPLSLHVFEQTGRGVLPWRWWLDDQHRVVLAAGGRRAYLLEAATKGGAA